MTNNSKQQKKRVAVLYGGKNTEHDVSLNSARNVIKNLDRELFDILAIKINHDGVWTWGDESLQLTQQKPAPAIEQQPEAHCTKPYLIKHEAKRHDIALSPEAIDVAFPVFHGAFGEDGCMQGLLELVGIPYVGAGVLASAVGMDKYVAKQLVQAAGISVAPFMCVKPYEWPARKANILKLIDENIGYPLFVKSINTGSSVGITKVKTPDEMDAALKEAFKYDSKAIIEKAVNAREIEISVLENNNYGEPALVSLPGEIVPKLEFFNYAAKYHDPDGAEFILPVELPAQQLQEVQTLARSIFEVLGCEGMARVDFFLDKDTNTFYFNEVNTLPGFTSMSVYPKLWEVSGLAYPELITHLLQLAIARHQRQLVIRREVSNEI